MFIKKVFLCLFTLIFASSALHPQNGKKLTIKGLKVISEEELYSSLGLERFEEGKIPLAEVISSIEKFYKHKKYSLVRIYATEVRTTSGYTLFVDEGRIGKIIVHNLNSYYSLKFKQQVNIPDRIYNTAVVEQTLKKLKNRFPGSVIRVELQETQDYEGNLIQLDRELQRLKLGEIFDTSFFERYTPLHDLHFYVDNFKSEGIYGSKSDGIGYNLDYKFPSVLIPQIYYYRKNTFFTKDYLESTLSIGLDPGFKGLFNIPPYNSLQFPPRISYEELTGEYKVSPMQNDFIGPLVRGRIYHSDTSRNDLGITHYSYLNTRATLAPEVTLLRNLNIYAGIGLEQILIYGSKINHSADKHLDSSDNTYHNAFTEARIKFDPIPVRIGNRIDKFIILTYTDYFSGTESNRLEVVGTYDTEFENLSIISLKAKAMKQFHNPPFYNNENVNSPYFKGFPGGSYYSNKSLSVSLEYRFSIYQDFIYAGAYIESVIFEPEGFLLSGTKRGINIGPTGRVLIYDQFELTVYFGFDRLLPDNTAGTSLQMKLTKKW